MTDNSRKRRITGAIALVTALVAVFAVLGGIGVAQSAISAAQYQYGPKKVTICHKGKKTISVGKKAAIAHMRQHGDTLGSCAAAKAKKAKAAKAKAAKVAKAKAAKAEAKARAEKAKAKHAEKGKPKSDDAEAKSSESSDKGNGKGKGRGK